MSIRVRGRVLRIRRMDQRRLGLEGVYTICLYYCLVIWKYGQNNGTRMAVIIAGLYMKFYLPAPM
jgi:hypothetical protein